MTETPTPVEDGAPVETGDDPITRAATAIQDTRGSGRLPDGRFGRGNTAAVSHGLHSRRVSEAMAAHHAERVAEIRASRGGDVSPIEERLIVELARLEIFSESLGASLMAMSPKATKGSVTAALARYHSNIDRQARVAQMLGLDRVTRKVPTVADYMTGKVDA
jgi:hypothetical protein